MLGEVPCEDVVWPRLPRLSEKGLAVGKGRGSSLAMFSSTISGGPGPGPPVSSIWSVAGFGVSEGPQQLAGQNLDHSWQGGLAPTVRLGEADLGFQKGLSDWGAQNLDRLRPLQEGGRPLLARGVWLRLSGSVKQIWGFRRASATGGPRTLTGSGHSWKGVGHSSGSRLSGSAKHGSLTP